ncbi:MAG: hypothetical protein H6733_06840 [Alphaproteobacteria bacterium]|nr:hypothetical protein [Alphaproteobacteria bacterium]
MPANPFEAPTHPAVAPAWSHDELVATTLRWQRAAVVLVVGWAFGSILVVGGLSAWRLTAGAIPATTVFGPSASVALTVLAAVLFARSAASRMAAVARARPSRDREAWLTRERSRWRLGVTAGLVLLTVAGAGMSAVAVALAR